MAYITEEYYRNVYCGNEVDGLDKLIREASDVIDNVTMMRIGGEEGLDRLSPTALSYLEPTGLMYRGI